MSLCNPFLVRRVVLLAALTTALRLVRVVEGQVSSDLQCELPNLANDGREQSADKLMMGKLAFLQEYHTDTMDHPGEKKLLHHLRGVSEMLKDWGVPVHVQDAGLFHSVFGTETFLQQAVPDTDRPLVRELIGEEAEALAWVFGNMNRAEFYKQVETFLKDQQLVQERNGFILGCTVHGDSERAQANRQALDSEKCELRITRQQIPELATLVVANCLEQARRYSKPDLQAWSKHELEWHLYLFGSLLPDKARDSVNQWQTGA